MGAPLLHLPVIDGLFGCVAFRCTISPKTCGARHLARIETRRGFPSALHPECDACDLGAANAGAAAPVKRRKVHPPTPPAPTVAAPKPPPPPKPVRPLCTKCHERPSASVRCGVDRATIRGQEGWCAPCRQRAHHLAWARKRREAIEARDAAPKPLCTKCHERPVARVLHGLTDPEHVELCRQCRDAARKRAAYVERVVILGNHTIKDLCERGCGRIVGIVRKDTRPELARMCPTCRTAVRGAVKLRAWRARQARAA